MNRSLALGVCLLVGTLSARAEAASRPWTLDDILAVRTVSDPQVSPDGRRVAYVVQELKNDGADYQTDVWLADTETGATRRLTTSPMADEAPRWSSDGKWIAFESERPRSDRKDEAEEGRRQVWIISPDGGEASLLTDAAGGVVSHAWSKDGRRVLYLAREPKSAEQKQREKDRDDAWTPSSRYAWNRLWSIEVASRKATQLTSGESHVTSFSIAPDGRRVVFAAQPTPRVDDGANTDLYLLALSPGAKPAPLVQRPGIDDAPVFSHDGRWVAFVSADGVPSENFPATKVCVVPAAGGRAENLMGSFEEPVGGAGGDRLEWFADDESIMFTASVRTQLRVYRAFTNEQPPEPLTPDPVVDSSPSLSDDGDVLVWLREDSTHPRDVWVWKISHGQPRRLTDHNPQVRELQAFEKRVISWPGADGRDMEGLLISPAAGRAGVKPPLLVQLHGGPTSSFVQTFTGGSRSCPLPLFAEEGWAILLPNPRGSIGYGDAFRRANLRDWGGKDELDVLAGVDALVKLGLVDERRTAVCGWSYGGYLTADIVSRTNRFQAAVVGAGMPDLAALAVTCDIPGAMRTAMQSWPWDDPQVYLEHSPLTRAGQVKTPTLIVQGAMDERVPPSQAWSFYNALLRTGATTDLLMLPRQGHGPREPRLQRAVMQWHHDWLTRYTLGAGLPKPGARPVRAAATPKEIR